VLGFNLLGDGLRDLLDPARGADAVTTRPGVRDLRVRGWRGGGGAGVSFTLPRGRGPA